MTENKVPIIVIDQFGYLKHSQKIAVIRNPKIGFDAESTFEPGDSYQVISHSSNEVVFSGKPQAWNEKKTDASSGDQAWWFDFSAINKTGTYQIKDKQKNILSHPFEISENPYKKVLIQALRTFYYQRAGHEKREPFAEASWTDSASHLGHLQDADARLYSDKNNAATERDLQGGWYDAGDYNKYTNWTADYIIGLLHSYFEKPKLWTDDFNIPESGNGVPDILDEIKWGMDWLIKMQNQDGSVLSIVALDHGSPPSSAIKPSYYGSASTSSTLSSSAAFALGAKIFRELGNTNASHYATELAKRAEKAWRWANANPQVIFRNNDIEANTLGLGAGQQEVDDIGRSHIKLMASIYLFELTNNNQYRKYFDTHYSQLELIKYHYANEFRGTLIRSVLHYSALSNATPAVSKRIQLTFMNAIKKDNALGSILNHKDPYRAFIGTYTWGSSSTKSMMGSMLYEIKLHNLKYEYPKNIHNIAQGYIHYLHGVNPLGKVFLSNMKKYGAENSVDTFYHSWFSDGSSLWDSVSESTFGPAPGFVVGGPNPQYRWDSFCDSIPNHQQCGTSPPSPPFAQPPQKSYKDLNTSWPINSWEFSENSNGYQTNYIRLLSKFVE